MGFIRNAREKFRYFFFGSSISVCKKGKSVLESKAAPGSDRQFFHFCMHTFED